MDKIMTISEVLPNLRALNFKDKIRAMQFLANEVAREEDVYFEEGKVYEIFSPYNSFEAAEQLRRLLNEKEQINA